MKASVLILILQKVGWIEVRQLGNHLIFKHPDRANLIAVPNLGDQILTLGLVNDIFEEAQLKNRIVRLSVPHPLKMIFNLLSALGLIKNR
jgi:predicted RNA binding protein YcfA (HicA-like mRNA interferase family)